MNLAAKIETNLSDRRAALAAREARLEAQRTEVICHTIDELAHLITPDWLVEAEDLAHPTATLNLSIEGVTYRVILRWTGTQTAQGVLLDITLYQVGLHAEDLLEMGTYSNFPQMSTEDELADLLAQMLPD